jgi:DHA3 family macrolide efflux protein-like MFS transporter
MNPQGWKKAFFTIWTGQAFSLVGSSLVQFALIWWLTIQAGNATTLAIAGLVGLLPQVILGPVVGALVDRWKRRWILIISDTAIALFTLVLAALYYFDSVEIWHVYTILFMRALGGAFHGPSMLASTSLMVPREHLARIAALNQTRQSVMQMGGPVLGSLLVSFYPIQTVLIIDLITASLAVIPLLFIDIPQPPKSASKDHVRSGARKSLWGETAEGIRYLWSWKGLFILTITIAIIPFFGMPAVSLVPLLINKHFGGGPILYGWYSLADQIGVFIGGILLVVWGGRVKKFNVMLTTAIVFGLFSLVQGLTPGNGYWYFLGATFMAGVAASMYFASVNAILQTTVSPETQGRVFSIQNSLTYGAGPIGLLVIGPLADVIGIQSPFLMRGVAALIVGLIWVLSKSVRNIEDTVYPPSTNV